MSLDLNKLENVRREGDKTIARCPACAESGRDSKGEHLVIYPGGRFCCVANTGDAGRPHRKRIFALVGVQAGRSGPDHPIRVRRPNYGSPLSAWGATLGTGFFNTRAGGEQDETGGHSDPDATPVRIKTSDNPSRPSHDSQWHSTSPVCQLLEAGAKFWVYMEAHGEVVPLPLDAMCVAGLLKLGNAMKVMPMDRPSGWQDPAVFGIIAATVPDAPPDQQ